MSDDAVGFFTQELASALINNADISHPRGPCSLDIANAVLALIRAEIRAELRAELRNSPPVSQKEME